MMLILRHCLQVVFEKEYFNDSTKQYDILNIRY